MMTFIAYGAFPQNTVEMFKVCAVLLAKEIVFPWMMALMLSYFLEKRSDVFLLVIPMLVYGLLIEPALGVMGATGPMHVIKPFVHTSYVLISLYLIGKVLILKFYYRKQAKLKV